MPAGADLLGEFEGHSPAGIRALLAAGVGPTEPINGKRPIDVLIEMYLRSSRFAECLHLMLNAGATLGDPLLQALLLVISEIKCEWPEAICERSLIQACQPQ